MKRFLKRFHRIPLPSVLELSSIHETWSIQYQEANQVRMTIKQIEPYQLLIKGLTNNKEKCLSSLQRWLKRKGDRHLTPWLNALSEDSELQFKNLTIRGQKSRWGSCSQTKSINLNYKLLFLPAPIVEHVLLHELCHTKQLNHSERFWKLLACHDSDYKNHRRLLKEAVKYLPKWLSY